MSDVEHGSCRSKPSGNFLAGSCNRNASDCAVDFCVRRGVRREACPLWIWQRLTTTSLRKKTRQTLRFYCMVPAWLENNWYA